jgi:hypothetical protein
MKTTPSQIFENNRLRLHLDRSNFDGIIFSPLIHTPFNVYLNMIAVLVQAVELTITLIDTLSPMLK